MYNREVRIWILFVLQSDRLNITNHHQSAILLRQLQNLQTKYLVHFMFCFFCFCFVRDNIGWDKKNDRTHHEFQFIEMLARLLVS